VDLVLIGGGTLRGKSLPFGTGKRFALRYGGKVSPSVREKNLPFGTGGKFALRYGGKVCPSVREKGLPFGRGKVCPPVQEKALHKGKNSPFGAGRKFALPPFGAETNFFWALRVLFPLRASLSALPFEGHFTPFSPSEISPSPSELFPFAPFPSPKNCPSPFNIFCPLGGVNYNPVNDQPSYHKKIIRFNDYVGKQNESRKKCLLVVPVE